MSNGPGDVIDDRFRLIERLGSGAMGTVWLALDEVLQREVALKEVRPADPGLAADPAYADMLRTRVLREARALARIHHPHVVTIHHVIDRPADTSDDAAPFPWLVMELVRGGTLADRLAAGPMEPAEVAELGRGLLGGLRAAHAAGICHRDVKPANVLLRPDGSPVLTDFGIADLADTSRLTATGGLTGSPAYMAPERLHGTEGDPASDLWSLGMLLYEAVEGKQPLRQSTAAATLAAVLRGVVPAAEYAGRLEPALRAVLVADPKARASAEELDALLVHAIDTPAYPGPPPVPEPPPPFVSRSAPSAADSSAPRDDSSTVLRSPATPGTPVRKSRVGAVLGGVLGAVALLLTVGVVVIVVAVLPWIRDQATLSAGGPPAAPQVGGASPSADPSGAPPESSKPSTTSPAKPKPLKLHTVKGMKQATKAYKKELGTTKFDRLVVYPDYAIADVPVKGRKGAVDRYMYRAGKIKLWTSGSRMSEKTTDIAKIDWEFLPKLLKKADSSLNLPKPESRYVIVDASGTFTDGKPAIFVHLSDKYGGGYLTADLDGNVTDINPAE